MRVKVYEDAGEFHFCEADAPDDVWPGSWDFVGFAEFTLYDEDGSERPSGEPESTE